MKHIGKQATLVDIKFGEKTAISKEDYI